jgi:hypothetical protein
MKSIVQLKNKHVDQDIWCIAAGSSMDYIDSSFFDNKIVIGQNQVYKKYPCTYVLMKDLMESPRFPRSVNEIKKLGIPLIYSKYHAGHHSSGLNKTDYENSYVYDHADNRADLQKHLDVIGTDVMAAKRSSITSIMNIAAYMGAKNIIVCGVDCGTINGKTYFKGYTEKDWKSGENNSGIKNWLAATDSLNMSIRDQISKKYDCNIYSLNPFMNFKLDGNDYTPC